MFTFSSVKKAGHAIKRDFQAFHLSHSLSELFKIYDFTGGPSQQVEAAINTAIERSLTEVGETKPRLQGHLYTLLRAKDLHRFVVEEPLLAPVKLKLLEHVLFYRGLEERWAAIRELLLSALDSICGVTVSGVASNHEIYKQQASERSSSLGKLLMCTALLNFDVDDEPPPTNLRIRFHRGRFPENSWELDVPSTAGATEDAARAWNPANPYCRWEYLGADLLHALYRRHYNMTPVLAGQDARGTTLAGAWMQPADSSPEHVGEVFCALGRGGDASAQTDQMELFPLHPRTFLPELQRQVHRAHGAEGVRLFALLCERLGRSTCGEFLSLALADIAAVPSGPANSPAKIHQRAKRLWGILEYLAQLELTRIHTAEGESTCRKSRFITILHVTNSQPSIQPGGSDHDPKSRDGGCPTGVRLMMDPVFYQGAGGRLRLAYRDLPEPLLHAASKEHPFALGLLVYLRIAWTDEWEETQGIVQRSTQRLFQEAGFWIKNSARYRSIEAMKRDLAYLKEQGWLGAWRITRGANRDSLEDIYRLEAPGGMHAPRARPAPGRAEATISA